jgi:hypothetical protein
MLKIIADAEAGTLNKLCDDAGAERSGYRRQPEEA